MAVPLGDMAWVNSPVTFVIALVALFVSAILTAILRGNLVTVRHQNQRENDWKERLAEQERISSERLAESREREQLWRDAHGEAEAAVRVLADQVEQLTVVGQTTVALLQALPKKELGT